MAVALAPALQTLAARLSEAQTSQALEPLLKQIGETTDHVRAPILALMLTPALQALAATLSEARASVALEPLLKEIGQATNPYALDAPTTLAPALQISAAKLRETEASQTLDLLVDQMIDPGALLAPAPALSALGPVI